ncbi:MAG: 3-dehydroquinate synthase [Lachnospiraceae bacterium]|nr:3-dehydroquinate synthase [Lachnospiraceae bacterium]
MKCIEVKTEPSYNVWIGPALTSQIGKLLYPIASGHRVAMISDMYVDPLYGGEVMNAIKDYGIDVVSIPMMVDEKTKTLSTVESLLGALVQENISKEDILLAVGGGLVSDIAGLTAALYMHGIRIVHMPTTLLSMVDASIGGKSDVNIPQGKDLAGVYYQPEMVVSDLNVLASLPDEEMRNAVGEIIKYAVIEDGSNLYGRLMNKIGRAKMEELEYIIGVCAQMKADIVAKDWHGEGERELLKLGHTAGGAIEVVTDYAVSHGEAVGLGMLIMAYGTGNRKTGDKIKKLLEKYNLMTSIDWPEREITAAALVKKNAGGAYKIVVPEEIGNCVIQEVSARTLTQILRKGLNAVGSTNQNGKRLSLHPFKRSRS